MVTNDKINRISKAIDKMMVDWKKYAFFAASKKESWPSGRRRTPGKCVSSKRASWVRIPCSPPSPAEALLGEGGLFINPTPLLPFIRATADNIRNMQYVYILQCNDNTCYVGCTSDLKERIKRHEAKQVAYTSSRLPIKLIFYCAFADKFKAFEFEKYLKSGSGRAFTKKHLI